jgi:pyruvate/2-oxoglutarate dehydrogenase complex dihydrolipoamide dehydrogenase (E3) component
VAGSAISTELGQVFARFGAQVTVVEALPRLLPAGEPEAGDLLATVFERDGIAVRPGTRAERVSHDGQRFTLALAGGGTVTGQRLLVATGRHANVAALGIGAYGLDQAGRTIAVDERMRAADGLWVIGDITGKGAFTHMSMYQAAIATRDILGQDGPPAIYRDLAMDGLAAAVRGKLVAYLSVLQAGLPSQGSRRGRPKFAMTLLSKRVIARIR